MERNSYKEDKIGQLNQLEKVLDAFENIFIKKKKKNWKFSWRQYSYDILNFLIIFIMDVLIKCILIKKAHTFVSVHATIGRVWTENIVIPSWCYYPLVLHHRPKQNHTPHPSTHTTLFWHPYDVVLTLWTLYGYRNDVVCLLGFCT